MLNIKKAACPQVFKTGPFKQFRNCLHITQAERRFFLLVIGQPTRCEEKWKAMKVRKMRAGTAEGPPSNRKPIETKKHWRTGL